MRHLHSGTPGLRLARFLSTKDFKRFDTARRNIAYELDWVGRLEIAGFHQFQKSRLSLAIRQQHDFAKHAAFAQHLVRVARAFDW
jgi:hypothetical protein